MEIYTKQDRMTYSYNLDSKSFSTMSGVGKNEIGNGRGPEFSPDGQYFFAGTGRHDNYVNV